MKYQAKDILSTVKQYNLYENIKEDHLKCLTQKK